IVNRIADEYYNLSDRHESKLTTDMIAKLTEHEIEQRQHVENLRSRVEKLAQEAGGLEGTVPDSKKQRSVCDTESTMAGLRAKLLAAQLEQAVKGAELEVATRLFEEESFDVPEDDV